MSNWYVVHTQVNREGLAVQHLRNQAFEVYLPRLRKRRRHARREQIVLTPMFPRYLFVRMDPAACRWRAINGTIGVSHLVSHGDIPTPVPAGLVEEIMAREGEDGAVHLPAEFFSKGEHLRIITGALADQVGLVESMTGPERVTLLLNLLGREVRVHMKVDDLARAS